MQPYDSLKMTAFRKFCVICILFLLKNGVGPINIDSKHFKTVKDVIFSGTHMYTLYSRSLTECLNICFGDSECDCVSYMQTDCKLYSRNECSSPLLSSTGSTIGCKFIFIFI